MIESNSSEAFFKIHASAYGVNVFAKNTIYEADYLIEEPGVVPGTRSV